MRAAQACSKLLGGGAGPHSLVPQSLQRIPSSQVNSFACMGIGSGPLIISLLRLGALRMRALPHGSQLTHSLSDHSYR